MFFSSKQAILAEIGGTDHAAEIRRNLTSDSVFNQVARRNVFGTQIGAQELLEVSCPRGWRRFLPEIHLLPFIFQSQPFSSSDGIQTTASLADNAKPTFGGWLSNWFGGGHKTSEPTPKPSKVPSNRPHFKHV